VALAHAAAAYQAGFSNECLAATRRASLLGCESPSLQRFYEASALFRLWESEEAGALVHELLEENPDFPEAWYLSAQIHELQGDEIGARRGYQEADRLAPEAFPRPTRISSASLDQVIETALKDLPEPFDEALGEVSIVIRDLPDWEMAQPESPDEEPFPPDLLGLFVGTDRMDKSVFDPAEQPGVIFLFQKNLERMCPDRPSLIDEIRITVWHELAHYLGFDEEEMEEMGLE
jgi:predicted Zn-dependent protease with MMP-like domain